MTILKTIFACFFIITGSFLYSANDTLRVFNPEQKQRFLDDKYYQYDNVPVDESESWFNRTLRNFFRNLAENTGIDLPPEIILYILAAFILFLILRNSKLSLRSFLPVGEKITSSGAVEISVAQSDSFLVLADHAIEKGLPVMALRYQFLHSLQLLKNSGRVNERENQTNAGYARQINDAALRSLFQHLIRIYDRTWYGEYSIDTDTYHVILHDFNRFNKQIGS